MIAPESRRAIRTLVQSAAILALLYFVWSWASRLDNEGVREVARWALAIIALFVAYTGAENFRRAKFEANVGGNKIGGELDGAD